MTLIILCQNKTGGYEVHVEKDLSPEQKVAGCNKARLNAPEKITGDLVLTIDHITRALERNA